jgi:hypothetical protein
VSGTTLKLLVAPGLENTTMHIYSVLALNFFLPKLSLIELAARVVKNPNKPITSRCFFLSPGELCLSLFQHCHAKEKQGRCTQIAFA